MTQIALMTSLPVPLSFLDEHLRRLLPDAELSHWPDPAALRAEVALCWKPPPGVLASMPKLRLVHSIAAGVDNILSDPTLPALPLCRIVDPKLAAAIAEYVLWGTLYFHRQFDRVIDNARAGHWHRYDQIAAADRRVGLLGLGAVGIEVAQTLKAAGYKVSAWSRTPKTLDGIAVAAGDAALDGFLARTDILVCLLPLTQATIGILNAERLRRLPQGAALILCSRGEHLVVGDLLELLRSGHLRGAILDVFEQEPLAADDPLWTEPGILVTPHMAGLAKPKVIAEQIAANVRRLQAGEPLLNLVDPARGY